MKLTRKTISIIITICMIISVISVGAVSSAAADTDSSLAQDTVQGSAVLHCFNWSYSNIEANLADIAAAGYTAVQTSPVQQPKDYSSSWTDVSGQWWKLYQPLGLDIADDDTSWLGTKSELASLCDAADDYGIKVIVDIVANHLANNGSDGGTYSYLNSSVDSDLQNSAYYHTYDTSTSDDSRFTITQYHLGMPDLNTSNSYIQGKVLDLLEECVDCGVDGFRFDAAKHIELPTDSSANCASDFWPTVIDGINDYTDEDLFIYGEILNSAGTDISNYTTYMNVTDNYAGDRALYNAYTDNPAGLAAYTYDKGAGDAQSVIWCESHDTYMGSSGSAGMTNTSGVDDSDIIKTWAIVGSRANSTALFFARPSTMGAASTDTTWKSDAVAEINKFKNLFDGTSEYLGYNTSYNCTYNERGTAGVVISKLDGSGYVSLTANQISDGTYTDQITGNTFTVSGGVITGTVGSTGVAVVYNSDDVSSDTTDSDDSDDSDETDSSVLYLVPNSNWTSDSARFAMYLWDASGNTAWASMTYDSDTEMYYASVPDGSWANVIFCRMNGSSSTNSWSYVWNQTNDLTLSDSYNCYTIASGAWSYGDGTWSLYETEDTATESDEETEEVTEAETEAETEETECTHSYGSPVWTWASDYSYATAVFTCSSCGETESVTDSSISSVTSRNSTTYTASVTFNGSTYTTTKTVSSGSSSSGGGSSSGGRSGGSSRGGRR